MINNNSSELKRNTVATPSTLNDSDRWNCSSDLSLGFRHLPKIC